MYEECGAYGVVVEVILRVSLLVSTTYFTVVLHGAPTLSDSSALLEVLQAPILLYPPPLQPSYSSSPPPHHLLDGVGNRMVLQAAYTALTTVLPTKYWPHAAVVAAILVVIYAYTQGPTTNRERDLHARIIILTVSSSFLSPLPEIVVKRSVRTDWRTCARHRRSPHVVTCATRHAVSSLT